jgi:hypothetical protein
MPRMRPPPTYTLEMAQAEMAMTTGQVGIMAEAHTKTNSTDPPNQPASGLISYSLAGHEKYASSDGNDYNTGRLSLVSVNDHTISSVTDVALPELGGISSAAAGTYTVRGIIFWQQTTTLITQNIGLQGANIVAPTRVLFMGLPVSGTTVSYQFIGQAITNTDIAFGGNVTAAAVNAIHISGQIAYSAADVMGLKGLAASGVNTWVVKAGSFIEFMPVT